MKYLKTLVCILLFASVSTSYAQNCGSLIINSQADVDNFVAANAGSCNVFQDITINFDADLSGMLFIQWVSGTLKVNSGVNLSSFQGLNNVQNIREVDIDGTVNSFENLDILRSIETLSIRSDLSLNAPTINFTGLESVTSLKYLSLFGVTIISFNSLQNVTSTNMGSFGITHCPGIQSINIFNSLKEVNGPFTIRTNPDLVAINGFNNLETVADNSNDTTETLGIYNNPLLNSIVGFSSLSSVESFILSGNSALNECCVFLPLIYITETYSLFNNASDCYNSNAVINYCQPITDVDGDGVFDISDNCILSINSDQSDIDNDGIGDVCDDDIDGDGFINENDNCPDIANNNQADANADGIGDLCSTQSGDGTGSFGVGTNMPVSKLHVAKGDVFIGNQYRGIIMKTVDGKCFRYRPDRNGMLIGKEIICPN